MGLLRGNGRVSGWRRSWRWRSAVPPLCSGADRRAHAEAQLGPAQQATEHSYGVIGLYLDGTYVASCANWTAMIPLDGIKVASTSGQMIVTCAAGTYVVPGTTQFFDFP
ncbi:MAG TPA: hypothetical protein VMS11_07225 [Solirubrobacterales bacterium]|nr:hypothetical protein [Solirubrobacterales bacterium]